MDIIGLHERAVDETARLVDGVGPEQLVLPTPCLDWDVRALLTHLVGGKIRWAALAKGEPLMRGPARWCVRCRPQRRSFALWPRRPRQCPLLSSRRCSASWENEVTVPRPATSSA